MKSVFGITIVVSVIFIVVLTALAVNISQPKLENIDQYDYERLRGHNAAIAQFGAGNEDLFVNLDNKRVIMYTGDKSDIDSAYSDGYHKALETLDRRNRSYCPDVH